MLLKTTLRQKKNFIFFTRGFKKIRRLRRRRADEEMTITNLSAKNAILNSELRKAKVTNLQELSYKPLANIQREKRVTLHPENIDKVSIVCFALIFTLFNVGSTIL